MDIHQYVQRMEEQNRRYLEQHLTFLVPLPPLQGRRPKLSEIENDKMRKELKQKQQLRLQMEAEREAMVEMARQQRHAKLRKQELMISRLEFTINHFDDPIHDPPFTQKANCDAKAEFAPKCPTVITTSSPIKEHCRTEVLMDVAPAKDVCEDPYVVTDVGLKTSFSSPSLENFDAPTRRTFASSHSNTYPINQPANSLNNLNLHDDTNEATVHTNHDVTITKKETFVNFYKYPPRENIVHSYNRPGQLGNQKKRIDTPRKLVKKINMESKSRGLVLPQQFHTSTRYHRHMVAPKSQSKQWDPGIIELHRHC